MSAIEDVKTDENVTLDTLTSRLGKKTIEIEQIAKQYDGHVLFHDFSYRMKRNDRIGIIGPNGCGKSTLLHILAKEITPDTGSVIHGETVKIAYFKQGHEEMDPDMRILDYIKETSMKSKQMMEPTVPPRCWNDSCLIQKCNIPTSGGIWWRKKTLYLLKVLMSAPNILFLDEPTNDLDIATLQILEDYLDAFNGALLVVSHDRYFLDRICDSLFIFQADGTIKSLSVDTVRIWNYLISIR